MFANKLSLNIDTYDSSKIYNGIASLNQSQVSIDDEINLLLTEMMKELSLTELVSSLSVYENHNSAASFDQPIKSLIL